MQRSVGLPPKGAKGTGPQDGVVSFSVSEGWDCYPVGPDNETIL